MDIPRAPKFLPLICYEIIFPGEGVPRGADRPDWLINVTNDAWFGSAPGPSASATGAIRAIEEGLPLVRAANSGISAVADPVGRIVTSLPLGTEGVLDPGFPRRLSRRYTPIRRSSHRLGLGNRAGMTTIRRRNGS